MTMVGFPTIDFPAPLPFVIELPEGWLGAHVPGALLAAYGPETSEASLFRPNVVVTWQRVPLETNVQSVTDHAFDQARRATPDAKVLVRDAAESDSFEAALTVFTEPSSTHPDLLHAGLFVVGPPAGKIRDLYQVVGTYSADDDAVHAQVRACLLSFALATPATEPVEGSD